MAGDRGEIIKAGISVSRVEDQSADYLVDCARLSPEERVAVIQNLRQLHWGESASSGLQRVVEISQRGES